MSPPPDADRRRTAPSYYILTNLGQRDEPPEKPYIIFYYPNKKLAFEKWDELVGIFTDRGLYAVPDLIRAGHPHEQGVSEFDFEGRMARLFK
jgi:hypothetical protein